MIVLCVDPGLAHLGLASVSFRRGRRARVHDARTIRTSGDLVARVRAIHDTTWEMAPAHGVPVLYEALTHLPDKGATAKVWCSLTAVVCAHTGPALCLDPQTIKRRLCGSRSAGKAQVRAKVAELVDGWDEVADNHASDAIAAGLAIMRDPAAWETLGA